MSRLLRVVMDNGLFLYLSAFRKGRKISQDLVVLQRQVYR
jgi:hypothetical protein